MTIEQESTLSKRALVVGAAGQDGSYLINLLVDKGYEVYALVRDDSIKTGPAVEMFAGRMSVFQCDLKDSQRLQTIIESVAPDEVYNLASQSHVGLSFERPIETSDVTAIGALCILEAIRKSKLNTKFYQASSSEMFGRTTSTKQDENTPFHPRSPYGCSKAYAHYIVQNYRESYGMYACSGILFNHESERRKESFVTRKITRAVGRIKAGLQKDLILGDTSAARDWGYAPDYVLSMWLMLQQREPEDYVIGTGVLNTVQEFLETAFEEAGLDYRNHLKTDVSLSRPSEVYNLCADSSKAAMKLGWFPKTSFRELVQRMVDHDIRIAEKEAILGK